MDRIIESYETLSNLDNNPGDLEVIKVELLKIKGFLQVLAHKIDVEKYHSVDVKRLQSKAKSYLKTYYFEKEIENISLLYSDDSSRLKNLRLTILDSLNDRRLMEYIVDAAREL